MDPVPGPSQGGDSVLIFLCRLVGDSSSSSPFAVGADGVHLGDGVGSSGVQFGAPPSLSGRLSGFSFGAHLPRSLSSAPVPPLAPPVTQLASSVAQLAPPVVQLAPPVAPLFLMFPP